MLPTFVIGLREGLEAALIVGIIAAFLRNEGRKDLLRWVFVGVGAAVALCVAVGIGLNIVSSALPQKQQEGLETVIGALAVAMVTYMVVWMKRNSRGLKKQLEGLAADAVNRGRGGALGKAGTAMVAMAFLAVLREGIETVVFLLAAFNESSSGALGGVGVVLGIAVAVALGYGIYRGGVRLNLSRFFRVTGVMLVLVAAGLVVNALHTAHEAGWLDIGQGRTFDLSWLVRPGTVQASLLTGMLGLQPYPVVIEVVGWLAYLIPVAAFIAWPPGRTLAPATRTRVLGFASGLLALAAVLCWLARPVPPSLSLVTNPGAIGAQVKSISADQVTVTYSVDGQQVSVDANRNGTSERDGVQVTTYSASKAVAGPTDPPPTFTADRVAKFNNNRLPLGLPVRSSYVMGYRTQVNVTVDVVERAHRVVGLISRTFTYAFVSDPTLGTVPLSQPYQLTSTSLSPAQDAVALRQAKSTLSQLDQRASFAAIGYALLVLAIAALGAAVGSRWLESRSRAGATKTDGTDDSAADADASHGPSRPLSTTTGQA